MAEASGMSETCQRSEGCIQDVEGNETSEDNCNGEPKIKCIVKCEGPDLSETAENSGESTGIKTTPSSFSLRSSKLNPFSSGSLPSTPNSKPFVLNPPKLSNPFLKTEKEAEIKSGPSASCSALKTPVKEENASTSISLNKSGVSFLPLGGEATTPSQPSSFSAASTPSLGFVFGQNIHEKVEAATPAESSSVAAAEPSPSKDTPEVTTNGTSSEILFQVPKENTEKTSEGSKSLSEAAREYEEARAVKRKYEEVPVLTGEEEEANVLQGFATSVKMENSAADVVVPNTSKRSLPEQKKFVLPNIDTAFLARVACKIAPLNTRSENPPRPARPREENRPPTRRPVYVRIPPARVPPTQPSPPENQVPSFSRGPSMQEHRVPYMPARPPTNIGLFLPPFSYGAAPPLRNSMDDYNIYGQFISYRLRGLEHRQKIYAEKLICEVLGEAELRNLEEDSRIAGKRRRV